jgi:ParB/RepB/Spo0J family partition protein
MNAKREIVKVSGLIKSGKLQERQALPEKRLPSLGADDVAREVIVYRDRPGGGEDSVRKIELQLIDDSPYQVRSSYDEDDVKGLAVSLDTAGQHEPIQVRPMGARFELLTGHTRVRAARMLAWREIEAFVIPLNDHDARIRVQVNNFGRNDITDYDKYRMFQTLIGVGDAKSQDQLAKVFSVARPTVSYIMRFKDLPEELLAIVRAYPKQFSHSLCREALNQIDKHGREELPLVLDGVRSVVAGDLPTTGLGAWIENQLRGRKPRVITAPLVYSNRSGKPAIRLLPKSTGFVIRTLAVKDRDGLQNELNDVLKRWAAKS